MTMPSSNHRESRRADLRTKDDAALLDIAFRFYQNASRGVDRVSWFEPYDDARQVCVERGLIGQLDELVRADKESRRQRQMTTKQR